jgi:hypothetical protein
MSPAVDSGKAPWTLSATNWRPTATSLPTDLKLVRLVHSAEEAVDEINQFYANFHSTRWLKRQFVVRMNHPLSERRLAHIQTAFADLRLSDDFQQLAYGGEEHDEANFSHLTRLVFNFNGRNQGRLRELVDYINLPENWAQAQGKTQQRVRRNRRDFLP